MIRVERRREMANLLKKELADRNVELKPQQFQRLVNYSKMNNCVGGDQYNCTYLGITVDVWLHNNRGRL